MKGAETSDTATSPCLALGGPQGRRQSPPSARLLGHLSPRQQQVHRATPDAAATPANPQQLTAGELPSASRAAPQEKMRTPRSFQLLIHCTNGQGQDPHKVQHTVQVGIRVVGGMTGVVSLELQDSHLGGLSLKAHDPCQACVCVCVCVHARGDKKCMYTHV